MNTKDDNFLIAEFMGFFKASDKNGNPAKFVNGAPKRTFKGADYRYDISWDWLMPVVEKIATIKNVKIEILPQFKNNGGVFRVHIDIPDGTDKTTDFTINRNLSIKAVHLAVLEFIKWYRSQPEGNTVESNH